MLRKFSWVAWLTWAALGLLIAGGCLESAACKVDDDCLAADRCLAGKCRPRDGALPNDGGVSETSSGVAGSSQGSSGVAASSSGVAASGSASGGAASSLASSLRASSSVGVGSSAGSSPDGSGTSASAQTASSTSAPPSSSSAAPTSSSASNTCASGTNSFCNGDTLRWCLNTGGPVTRTYDCTTLIPGAAGHCGPNPDLLMDDCVFPRGSRCRTDNGTGFSCAEMGDACVGDLDWTHWTCRASFPACVPNMQVCGDADFLQTDCAFGQPNGILCGAHGATCAADHCVDAGAGALCDDFWVTCATGLTCNGVATSGIGTCTSPSAGGSSSSGASSGSSR